MTDCPPSVRLASPDDAQEVYDLFLMAHAEVGMAPHSEKKVKLQIANGVLRTNGLIGLVQGPKRIEAMMILVIASWWYTEEKHLEEIINYVHPEHRRSTHAQDLIQFAKWAQERLSANAAEHLPLVIGVFTNERVEAKIRLYQRQLNLVGAMFTYDGPDGVRARPVHIRRKKRVAPPPGSLGVH